MENALMVKPSSLVSNELNIQEDGKMCIFILKVNIFG